MHGVATDRQHCCLLSWLAICMAGTDWLVQTGWYRHLVKKMPDVLLSGKALLNQKGIHFCSIQLHCMAAPAAGCNSLTTGTCACYSIVLQLQVEREQRIKEDVSQIMKTFYCEVRCLLVLAKYASHLGLGFSAYRYLPSGKPTSTSLQ